MYIYKALVTKVYDGDSITCSINLGFGVEFKHQKIRLADINTPEIRGEERESGLVSRDVLKEKILNKEVLIETFKDRKGKYGRYIAIVYLEEELSHDVLLHEDVGDKTTTLVNINEWLVKNGYAKYKKY